MALDSKVFELIGFTANQAFVLSIVIGILVWFSWMVLRHIKSLSKDVIGAVATAASEAVKAQFSEERQHRIYANLENQTATTTPQNISYSNPAPASGQQTNVPQQSPIQSFSNSSSPHRRT